MTTTDLRKIGLKRGNDVSENLAPKFPSESRATSLTPLPLFPQEIAPMVQIIGLTGHEWFLTLFLPSEN